MVQRREDLRFPFEPGQAVRVERQVVGEDLEGDVSAQRGVAGFPHLAHPAGPDGREDFIRAEANAGAKGPWASAGIGSN